MSLPFPILDRHSPRPLFGLHFAFPNVGALERIGPDWDWLWIDGQHGDLSYADTVSLVRTADLIRKPALVRIPGQDATWAAKLLDVGAAGIIVPMVESLDEAKAMVRATKFPPLGNRSFGGRRVGDRLGRNYYKAANQDTVLILQVESLAAVALSGQLAALEGVDGLFLGPDDLTIREGKTIDSLDHLARVGPAAKTMTDACRQHGKLSVGTFGVADEALAVAKSCGFNLLAGGGEAFFLGQQSKAASTKLRQFFGAGAGA